MGGSRGRLTSASDREMAIKLVDEAKENGAREFKACEELGISQRTIKRWRKQGTKGDLRLDCDRPVPKNKLSEEERGQILKIINEPEFKSKPPSQIVPALADLGIYIASESTIYRVMHEAGQQNHRGQTKEPSNKPKSTHCATEPNQVWTWDITYMPGPVKGLFYYLYMIVDIFSRDIVGWEVWEEEKAENASLLIRRAVMAQNITRKDGPLVLHSDNGSPMKGATMLETLYRLGITPSRSRPRVSNDNPYSESLFRTFKYTPTYPRGGFAALDEARAWVKKFVNWYRHDHHHSGIKFLTPHQRHNGQGEVILKRRKQVYEEAKAKYPERWSRGIRDWSLPTEVWLNPEKQDNNEKVKSEAIG